jgi:Flp pilus assembly protein TadD
MSTLSRAVLTTLVFTGTMAALPADARRPRTEVVQTAGLGSEQLLAQGAAALQRADARAAASYFAELAAREPRNGTAHTLLAMAHHLDAARDPAALDMALSGYDLALRAEPGQYWAAAMAGRGAFDRGHYQDALSHFARALLMRPNDARTAAALASAAYMAGDAPLASLAAGRAAALEPGPDGHYLRLAALAAAAAGDAPLARARLETLRSGFPATAAAAEARVAALIQTAAVDPLTAAEDAPLDGEVGVPDQISVDVAIILAQNTRRERTGFNLLDGLGLQYGFNREGTRTITRADGAPTGNNYQRVLTATISVPQLNYNLNLFNRGGQYYSVVARPQLTAYRGEESEFFIGRTLKVGVGGINLGNLENIDIGVEMKVTPQEITADGAKIRIDIGRSFLTADAAGNFAEALTTFRQKVAATAEVRFGETLVLSGLNETVDDRNFSKTPVLGDLPIIGNAFNERTTLERRDSVIVLVTPSRPVSLSGRAYVRGEHVDLLTRLWTDVIDPSSNAGAVAHALSRSRSFSRMTRSDAPMAFPGPREATAEALGELVLPGSN